MLMIQGDFICCVYYVRKHALTHTHTHANDIHMNALERICVRVYLSLSHPPALSRSLARARALSFDPPPLSLFIVLCSVL